MKYFSALFLLLIGISVSVHAQNHPPVNKNASPEAKTLLKYLYSIQDSSILSGQHNFNRGLNKYFDVAHQITGKYPAIWGSDFIWQGTRDLGDQVVLEAIKKYRQDYIITLMWHAGRPVDDPPFGWKESVQGKLTDAQWKALITAGTALHTRGSNRLI